MNFMWSLVKIFALLLTRFHTAKTGEVYYQAEFCEEIKSCSDFKNDVFICDGLKLASQPGEGDEESGGLGFSGFLETLKPVEEGCEIEIKIWKFLDIGKEFMYNVLGDICSSLNRTDTPWFPLFQSLNRSACPIPVDVYKINNMKMSLDFAKDILCHDFCGMYELEFSIVKDLDTISCHVLQVAIVEKIGE